MGRIRVTVSTRGKYSKKKKQGKLVHSSCFSEFDNNPHRNWQDVTLFPVPIESKHRFFTQVYSWLMSHYREKDPVNASHFEVIEGGKGWNSRANLLILILIKLFDRGQIESYQFGSICSSLARNWRTKSWREKGLERMEAHAMSMHTPGTRWNGGKGHSGNRVSNSVGSRKPSSQRERSGGTLFSDRGTHARSIIDRNNIGIVPFPSSGTGSSWQSGRANFERPFAETVEYRDPLISIQTSPIATFDEFNFPREKKRIDILHFEISD